jgi:hypothetical protein
MMLRTISALLVLNVVCAWGESPWLPGAGKASVTLTYVDEAFSSYWSGTVKKSFPQPPSPATVFGQSTGYGLLEYGLSDRLSVDMLAGYTATTYGTEGVQGMSDSQIGMRWQVYSDERSAITLRGAANIAGSYPLILTNRFNAGDKASGGQGSVLAGTTFSHGIYVFGEAGWRYRDKPVPNVFFGSAGIGDRIGRFSYGLAYQHNQALSGLDIGTPSFHGFPQLRETMQIQQILDANVGYTTAHGLYFGFDYAHLLNGRNTGDKQILAFTFGFTIPGRGPSIH